MEALKFFAIMLSIATICSRPVEATEDILIEQMDGIEGSVGDEHPDSSDQSFTEAVKKAFTTPSILRPLYSVLTTGVSFGILLSTLKLDDFPGIHLSPLQLLSVHTASSGFCYVRLSRFMAWWGCFFVSFLFSRSLSIAPKLLEISGAVLISAGLYVLGPFPAPHFQRTLTTITVGIVLHGVGVAASVVGGFGYGTRESFILGIFILGAQVGKVLHSSGSISFDRASLIIVFMEVVNIVLTCF